MMALASRGSVSKTGWDLQRIDLGIALCHFELMAKELGYDVTLSVSDPGLPQSEGVEYIATFAV